MTTNDSTQPPSAAVDSVAQAPAPSPSPRGMSRPPFPRGNAMRLRHGARSPSVYLPLAREIATELLADRPDLAAYPHAVARWAEWEGRARLLRRHLAQVGDLDGDGPTAVPRTGIVKWLKECEAAAERAAAVLGLDPRSEAKLAHERASAATLAVDLHAIAARGAQTSAAQDHRHEIKTNDETDHAGQFLAAAKARSEAAWENAYAALGLTREVAAPSSGPAPTLTEETR